MPNYTHRLLFTDPSNPRHGHLCSITTHYRGGWARVITEYGEALTVSEIPRDPQDAMRKGIDVFARLEEIDPTPRWKPNYTTYPVPITPAPPRSLWSRIKQILGLGSKAD